MSQRRNVHISRPNSNLMHYIKPLTTHKFEFLVSFSISEIACSRTDLIGISELVNIQHLTIGPGIQVSDGKFDNGIIRAWARAACESASFCFLRVLAFRRQVDFTQVFFQYAAALPSLGVLLFEGCNPSVQRDQEAICHYYKWEYASCKGVFKLLRNGNIEECAWDEFLQAADAQAQEFCKVQIPSSRVTIINNIPIVDMAVGRAQANARYSKSAPRLIKCYYRTEWSNHLLPEDFETLSSSKKRDGDHDNSRDDRPGKRKIKASMMMNNDMFLFGA
jgi:hypothetical protein